MKSLKDQFGNALSRAEMKNIFGGEPDIPKKDDGENALPCDGKSEGDWCHLSGGWAKCGYWPTGGLVCSTIFLD